jgi:hypothetical protein
MSFSVLSVGVNYVLVRVYVYICVCCVLHQEVTKIYVICHHGTSSPVRSLVEYEFELFSS